ncbi:MAG TPA: hypothetical protein VNS08_02600 [Ureibacillus sp.]|nr:hypothetical protein [Ureibacillus sp.]
MKRKHSRKIFAIFMIAFLLFWSALPSISMAFFITPGKPITPGQAITGGQPITGGQFILPGDPIQGGEAYNAGPGLKGGNTSSSGQPIVPPYQNSNGQFIPAIPSSLPINKPITAGDAITGGQGPSGGQGANGGNATEGGTNPTGGNAINGGDGQTGGTSPTGGDGSSGGNPVNGGEGPSTGESLTGGDSPNGGDGSTSGGSLPAGDPSSGNVNNSNGTTPGGDGTGGGTGAGSGTANPSFAQQTFTALKDTKKMFVSIPNYLGQMLDGGLSVMAGFKITDLKTASGKRNLIQVDGRATAVKGSGSISTWLNMRYSDYLNSFENSKSVVRGKGGSVAVINSDGTKSTRNYAIFQPRSGSKIKQKHVQGFINEVTSFKSVWTKTKDYMKKNWIPLDKWKVNKDFFKAKSVLAKGNGIANIVLSVGSRLAENAADPKRTGTDLAAGITTDVLLGAGQTAISAGAGWGASVLTAAAVGSVVPGVGTIVGAGVGLGLALFMSSNTGKTISRKVESVVKSGIEWVKNSKLGKGIRGLFGG